jgi:hypothetical protein
VLIALGPRPQWARFAIGAFGVALALAVILVVRNGFGVAFTSILAALSLLIAIRGSATFAQGTLLFLAVQLALSVYSRGDYLFMKQAETEMGVMPSDTQHMAMAMGGSYWFWGLLCAIFSAAMLAIGAYVFWRGTHRGPVVRKPVPGGLKLSPRKPG